MKITATLKNARKVPTGANENYILNGEIHKDTLNRGFIDGERIYTSRVIKESPGGIFQTLHNTYLAEFAA